MVTAATGTGAATRWWWRRQRGGDDDDGTKHENDGIACLSAELPQGQQGVRDRNHGAGLLDAGNHRVKDPSCSG